MLHCTASHPPILSGDRNLFSPHLSSPRSRIAHQSHHMLLYPFHIPARIFSIFLDNSSSVSLISSVLKWARSALRRASSPPLRFPSASFEIVPPSEPLEEEHLEEFSAGAYYPVNIGDVYHSKYQVVGKLGFGSTSTVWLAKNSSTCHLSSSLIA